MEAIVLLSSDPQKDGHHPSMQGARVVEHLFNPTIMIIHNNHLSSKLLGGELSNGHEPLTTLP